MKKDRYISELHKNTLYYNIVCRLEKCNNDEERSNLIKTILDNFEMTYAIGALTEDDIKEQEKTHIKDKMSIYKELCDKIRDENKDLDLVKLVIWASDKYDELAKELKKYGES
jgi:hypothetical protein